GTGRARFAMAAGINCIARSPETQAPLRFAIKHSITRRTGFGIGDIVLVQMGLHAGPYAPMNILLPESVNDFPCREGPTRRIASGEESERHPTLISQLDWYSHSQ